MPKKTTKKSPAKPGKKKAVPKKASKTAKKTVKKSPAKKSTKKAPAKKAAAKKSASTKTTKKSVAKKTTNKTTKKKPVAKKAATKPKAPAKKSTTKKKSTQKTKAQTKAVDPKDNGQTDAAPKPVPSTIRRVVRPNPIPPAEPPLEDWTPLSDAKLRKIKSGLSRKELNEFKQLLLEKRAEIVGDVIGMEEARAGGNGGELSNMPLHMADVGSDNYEQEFTLGLVESERKLLVAIDAALMRIQNKTYGICIVTGNPIPPVRLEIKPWAKYSIEVVREREKLGLHSF